MGLAISHYDELMLDGLPAQIGVLSLIGDYVKWFEDRYGSAYCRDRSGVKSSKECEGLIELATNEASKAIEMYKPMMV